MRVVKRCREGLSCLIRENRLSGVVDVATNAMKERVGLLNVKGMEETR